MLENDVDLLVCVEVKSFSSVSVVLLGVLLRCCQDRQTLLKLAYGVSLPPMVPAKITLSTP